MIHLVLPGRPEETFGDQNQALNQLNYELRSEMDDLPVTGSGTVYLRQL